MPATSTFIVISFAPDRRRQLKPSLPQQFKLLDRAVAYAERQLGRAVGSAVVEQLPDEYAEPKLVKAFGHLPDGFADALAA